MPGGHRHTHYKIQGALVAWAPWTFWHWFKKERVLQHQRRHEVRSISKRDIDFLTRHPPAEGQKVLLNIFLPDEPFPYIVRGVTQKIKTKETKEEALVRVKFRRCPQALAIRLSEIGDTVI